MTSTELDDSSIVEPDNSVPTVIISSSKLTIPHHEPGAALKDMISLEVNKIILFILTHSIDFAFYLEKSNISTRKYFKIVERLYKTI